MRLVIEPLPALSVWYLEMAFILLNAGAAQLFGQVQALKSRLLGCEILLHVLASINNRFWLAPGHDGDDVTLVPFCLQLSEAVEFDTFVDELPAVDRYGVKLVSCLRQLALIARH